MLPYTIPDPGNIANIADWAEFFLAHTREELAKSELGAYIEGSAASEADEALIDSVWQELEYRQLLYGEAPPFEVETTFLKTRINWEDIPEYMACLIFALEGNPNDSLASGTLFERITENALRNFLSGKSLRTGFPDKKPVADIAAAMKEHFVYECPSYRQDRDLDVVAWKDFGDSRCSQLVILMQCAAGHNWQHKLKDLNVDAWRKYIHFACRPVKGFAVPVIISDMTVLEEHSTDAGVILDRTRIYRNTFNNAPPDSLRGDLQAWCIGRIGEMVD